MTRCLDTHGSLDTLMRILATEAVCRVCILGLGNLGLVATGFFALFCTLASTLAGTGLLRRCCILGELDGLLRPLVAISPSMTSCTCLSPERQPPSKDTNLQIFLKVS